MGNVINFYGTVQKMKGVDLMTLTKEKMVEIEEKVDGILQKVDLRKTPYVDIVSLVKKDGFEVRTEEMDIETTGCLFVNNLKGNKDETSRLIVVNTMFKNPDNEDDVVFKKSRFITAHEYGHFILHRKEGQPIYAHRDTYHREDEEELEADYFARSILMPFAYFEVGYSFLKDFSKDDEQFICDKLSEMFRVTKNKVKKRIGDLAILAQ